MAVRAADRDVAAARRRRLHRHRWARAASPCSPCTRAAARPRAARCSRSCSICRSSPPASSSSSGRSARRYGPENLFSIFPIRYGGPYLLAWLARTRRGATAARRRGCCRSPASSPSTTPSSAGRVRRDVAALAWAQRRPLAAHGGRGCGRAAVGLLAARRRCRCSRWPRRLAAALRPADEFARLYGIDGFGLVPMPTLGFHLAVYVTFAAALVLATVRAVARRRTCR